MCGNGAMSPIQNQIYNDILTNVISRNSDFIGADTILRKVPITFVMATSAEIDLGKLLTDADSAFADMNISFDPYDTLIVENTQFYHLDDEQNGGIEEGKEFRKAYHHFYSLNVYIVDTLVGRQGFGKYCGINEDYYGFANWVILSNYNGGIDSTSNSFTIIHELGHHFCLKHTHAGEDDNKNDCIFKGPKVEFVNKDECNLRGDKLCDTPADPNLDQFGLVNIDCTFDNTKCKDLETYDLNECFQTVGDVNGDGEKNIQDIILAIDGSDIDFIDFCSDDCDCLDANGDPYLPDTGNYMSYTRETCGDHFSPLQKAAIIIQYDNNELNRYLDCNGEFMGTDWSCSGCMGPTACNYDLGALIEDYSCEFPIEGFNCDGEELINNSSIKPYNYLLSIYPNPFNPITTISYSISQFMGITITIYDINGRELETLINTNLNPGNYSLNWNASHYPSGVYFIRMDSGESTKIHKVALVK